MEIRDATLDDLESITEIYNEAILTTTATFDLEPKTVNDQTRWFEQHGERYPVIVATIDGQVVGWSSITRWRERCAYNDTAETSFYVKQEHRGKGVGRALKAAIIEAAEKLGYHSLIAGVAEGSEASLHLNKSFGFELIGTFKDVGYKFGKRLDVTYLQKILKQGD